MSVGKTNGWPARTAPVEAGTGAPSSVMSMLATPLKARARSMYSCTTATQVVRPARMAWCSSSMVASSRRNG